jgi:glycosyltransferase involved in cell wall biosynthesis
MRVGINALYLLPGKVGGSESYLRALLRALQSLPPKGDEFVLYTNREAAGSFELRQPTFRESVVPVRAESRVGRILVEQTLLPATVRRDRIDVLHSPGNTAPLVLGCPSVTTLHDVGYHFHPEDWSKAGLLANRVLIPPMTRRAASVIAISKSCKREILDVIGVEDARVRVIYHGVDGNVAEANDAAQTAIRARLGLEGPFLLAVSGTHPHKNLDGLLRIYNRLAERRAKPAPLVIVGVRGTHQERIEGLARGSKGRVILTGWISDQELGALYHSAHLLLFLSLYEGFGFPPLEAMSVGLPVVSSNMTSLPEVVGDGGLLVDPRAEEAVVEAIERAWADDALRADLRQKGRAQAARFTWAETARQTLDVLRAAATS